MSVCWPWRIASRKLPCASSGFSTGKNGRRPAGNNLAALQQKELELHKQLAADENARTELRNQLQSLSEQIDREELDKREQQEKLSQSLSAANALFGNDAWQTGWNKDPESFPGDLDGFRPPVASQRGTPAGTGTGAERPSSGTGSRTRLSPPLRKQYEDAAKAYDEKNQSYTRLRSERNLLLGGQPADQVERTFHERVEALKSHLKQLQESTTRHAGEVEQYRGLRNRSRRIWRRLPVSFPHAGRSWITGWSPIKRTPRGRRWRNPCRK